MKLTHVSWRPGILFKNYLHRASLLLLLVSLLIAIQVSLGHKDNPQAPRDSYEELNIQDKTSEAAELKAGIFVQKLYDFDPESKTFWANGYFWIKWKDAVKAYNTSKAGDGIEKDLNRASAINPMGKIEFLNAVVLDDMTKTIWPEEPYRTKDGWNYQSVTFSGKFIASDVNYSRFPFEELVLPIEIETDGFWITEAIFTLDDIKGQGLASSSTLQGYRYTTSQFKVRKHVYSTSFGLTADAIDVFGSPFKSIYPNFVSSFVYQREPASTSWQLFVPLAAVLFITVVSPLIDARNTEPKVALPASVILALVFLQQGYREMLPRAISYLTFMDKIYSIAYIITVIVFIFAVYATNAQLREPPGSRRNQQIKRYEKKLCVLLVLVLIISPYAAWLSS